jgi:hypothetical protein
MHTGGAYIEAFIAFGFPALAVWLLTRRSWSLRLVGVLAVAATSYAMTVTFSRGGYAGLVIGLLVVAVGILRRKARFRLRRALVLAGLGAVTVAAAVPVLSGGFAQYRLARAADDLAFRLSHWSRAVQLMDGGVTSSLLGEGFGRYPTLYLYGGDGERPPGTYRIVGEGDNRFLRLGAGETVFLDQRVRIEPGKPYLLSARVRQTGDQGSLAIPICEKALLYSFECLWPDLQLEPPNSAGWTRLSAEIHAGKIGARGNWPHRPVKLSLHNAGADSVIDVDDVSLKTLDGREMLANGDFSSGAKRWLFVTDQDLAWHIHQQEVEMYFAQGALGLVAFSLLLLAVGRALRPAFWVGDSYAVAMAAGLAAFLTVGLLGSTIDTARLAMLFWLAAFLAVLLPPDVEHPEG